MMSVMKKARLPIRHDEVEELMRRYDPDDSGGFDFREFAELLASAPGLDSPRRRDSTSPRRRSA